MDEKRMPNPPKAYYRAMLYIPEPKTPAESRQRMSMSLDGGMDGFTVAEPPIEKRAKAIQTPPTTDRALLDSFLDAARRAHRGMDAKVIRSYEETPTDDEYFRAKIREYQRMRRQKV